MKLTLALSSLLFTSSLILPAPAAATTAEVKNLSINGGLEDGKAKLVIEAVLNGLPGEKDKVVFATTLQHSIKVTRDKITDAISATFDIITGEQKELTLGITGEGEIRQITGTGLEDWSIRQETNGLRTLVLRPRKADKPITQLAVSITAEHELKGMEKPFLPLTLIPPQPALLNGFIKVESAPELDVQPGDITGLIPIELKLLPEPLRAETKPEEPEALAFRFQGAAYSLPLNISLADPEARRVVLRNFKLVGRLNDQTAAFTLTATAHVKNPKGGSLVLLAGGVALTDLEPHPGWRVRLDQDRLVAVFDEAGEFPIQIKFNAAVHQNNAWQAIDFRVAPTALQPIILQGLPADTRFDFAGAARPERAGEDFASFLPADGAVKLSWKEARAEGEGKLFYAAEMLSQISVSPGLMRQLALLDFKVMQGELNRVSLLLRGAGEVTRVQGDQVLAWHVEPVPESNYRVLVVQLNQAQKDQFSIQVQMQTPLGSFPQTTDAIQLRPQEATRFAGYFRIVNEGAVRLEVLEAAGLSQISPDQFPQSDATKALFRLTGSQRFAYRFSGADFALRIQADQILPELTVSQVLAYHLGENELAIDAEIELDIREAPLRELVLRVPKGYAIARISAPGLNDYPLRDLDDQPDAELRLVYGQPVSGRQVVQLRLERHKPLGGTSWALPRVEVAKAKSVRGHVGASADTGFRLTAERTQGLTEIATAFFPRKVAGLQAAFRLSDPAWQATLRVERLPQTIQADAFHLFSIGEGIAYGSSVLNYVISGAPVSSFKIELSDEYFNVEFTGKDIRNPRKTEGGYVVQLNSPVSGSCTVLATYERPFKAQGDTLTFTGARPLDAQTEQGHTLIISAYQFKVQPADVSPGLLPLEPGEVPPEYRLFFDAPILASYRYTSRPFNLKLALSPLAQGDSISQVVDRASIVNHISKEGQVLTDVRYFVKNRGNPHFKLMVPDGTQLWSATVNGASVVPVTDGKTNLISLPQHADPDAVLTLDLKLALRSKDPKHVFIAAPVVDAPVMLAEWKLEPDTGQRLVYRQGSLTPTGGVPDISGFAQLARTLKGDQAGRALVLLFAGLALVGAAVVVWRWTCGDGVYKFSARHFCGTFLGLTAAVMAAFAFTRLAGLVMEESGDVARNVAFLAPVQQAGSALQVEVANLADQASALDFIGCAWPVLFAFILWGYGWVTERPWFRSAGWVIGWTLLAWAALRCPNGAVAFLFVMGAFIFLHVVIPALRKLWQAPRQPQPTPPAGRKGGAAPAVAALLLGGIVWVGFGSATRASTKSDGPFPLTPALSPGERENRGQAVGESKVVRNFEQRASPLPLPGGEGWGEGERGSEAGSDPAPADSATIIPHSLFPNYFTSNGRTHWPAIIRERMGRAFLQGLPDRIANDLFVSVKVGVPKPQDFDAAGVQPGIAFGILEPLHRRSMLEAVQLDVHPGLQAEEVENVQTERVLPPKLVFGKSAVSQPAPKEFFGPSVVLAHHSRNADQLGVAHTENVKASLEESQAQASGSHPFPLTPALTPEERENSRQSVGESGDVRTSEDRGLLLPLPGGEGWGEGERVVRTTATPVLLAQATTTASPSPAGKDKPSQSEIGDKADRKSTLLPKEPPLAESVTQDIRIEDKFALATAKVRWQAIKGQLLPLVFEPAVVTRVKYPTDALKLVQASVGGRPAQELLALQSGAFEIEVEYQLQVTRKDAESGFGLPMQYGIVNRLKLTLVNLDVDVSSLQAVSIDRSNVGSNTVASLVLAPVKDTWIGWKPRSRDVKREKAVFYAEVSQLYVPSAGVIEGAHFVSIRPAQGELTELVLDVPKGATITDVIDPAKPAAGAASLVSLWRFDPDTRKLRVTLNPAQSRPFTLVIRSQVATGPLPFEQSVGLINVDNAAGQIGLLGIATGNEVQLDTVTAEGFSPINLEDFPNEVTAPLQAQIPGLTVRRAFRYADTKAVASVKASPVEPDVRVETQDTLSLGEDRTVLAANLTVSITRAGIFRLSFLMPSGFDVESITGAALSHWTELKTDAGRVITLHLNGKTEGQQQFAISLAGPGVKATNAWTVPQLVLREAGKQGGSLLLAPEQGMRLQAGAREGLTQLDPQKSGIRQKGVLAFRILQTPWSLALDIEQVEPWIQVTSLQHATVNEAQVKVVANLQYQIENTGLKAFHVFIPTNAESVKFQGDQVADFLPVAGAVTNGLQQWEIKLHRRVIGAYLLQVTYQTLMPEQTPLTVLRGVQAADVNLQRGFVTVQSAGRLQLHVDATPEALQPTEWQSIPRALQQDLQTVAANFAYRLVEPGFQLPLKIERHEAAKLLPARVNNITFNSVISDAGMMLTRVRLEMLPGDKRLLNLVLPKGAQFWFAFVNQNGVWPWREEDKILIPLEQQSRGGNKVIPVEFFYTCKVGAAGSRSLDLELLAPRFDLPLENLTWRVSLSDKWQLNRWSGSLQLQQEEIVPQTSVVDLQTYLQNEAGQQRERTKEAEELMAAGNTALAQGDPQQARRSFQAAYGLSTHDAAFNEDARVQLHNIKLQQALIGLNVRQAAATGEPGALGGKFRDLRGRKEVSYTQQDAKDIIDRNNADENAAFMRLAERLIQQQDAAVSSPAAIRANIPEQGRVLTFKRAVVVDELIHTKVDLKIDLQMSAARAASWGVRILILAATLVVLAIFAAAARSFRRSNQA